MRDQLIKFHKDEAAKLSSTREGWIKEINHPHGHPDDKARYKTMVERQTRDIDLHLASAEWLNKLAP